MTSDTRTIADLAEILRRVESNLAFLSQASQAGGEDSTFFELSRR